VVVVGGLLVRQGREHRLDGNPAVRSEPLKTGNGRMSGTSVSRAEVETLRLLARTRHEYAANGPTNDQLIIQHEAAVFEAIADALTGKRRWDDLVAGYAPSWRWSEFGEHDPNMMLGFTESGVSP
jgi:hypothetical protein